LHGTGKFCRSLFLLRFAARFVPQELITPMNRDFLAVLECAVNNLGIVNFPARDRDGLI